jgi:hypothetical protein
MSANEAEKVCTVTELYFYPPTVMSLGDSKPISILAVQIARARKDLAVYLLIDSDVFGGGSLSGIIPYIEHMYKKSVKNNKEKGIISVENLSILGSQSLAGVGEPNATSALFTPSLDNPNKPVETCTVDGKKFTKCFVLDFGDNSIQGGLCDLENKSGNPPVTLRFALRELDELNDRKSYFPPLLLPSPVNFSYSPKGDETVSGLVQFVKGERKKQRRILGVMITQTRYLRSVPHILSKVPEAIQWSFVVMGISEGEQAAYTKPASEYDTSRIHLPTGFVHYEELIHHCDAVLVGCGAGSVTAPLVLGKPVFLQSVNVDGGSDTTANKDTLANLFNEPEFGLQEMLRKDPDKIKFCDYPLIGEPKILIFDNHSDIVNSAVVNDMPITFLSSFLARRLRESFFEKYLKIFTEVSLTIRERVNKELEGMPVRFMGVVNGTNCQKCTKPLLSKKRKRSSAFGEK